jgi:hypothetical protein
MSDQDPNQRHEDKPAPGPQEEADETTQSDAGLGADNPGVSPEPGEAEELSEPAG